MLVLPLAACLVLGAMDPANDPPELPDERAFTASERETILEAVTTARELFKDYAQADELRRGLGRFEAAPWIRIPPHSGLTVEGGVGRDGTVGLRIPTNLLDLILTIVHESDHLENDRGEEPAIHYLRIIDRMERECRCYRNDYDRLKYLLALYAEEGPGSDILRKLTTSDKVSRLTLITRMRVLEFELKIEGFKTFTGRWSGLDLERISERRTANADRIREATSVMYRISTDPHVDSLVFDRHMLRGNLKALREWVMSDAQGSVKKTWLDEIDGSLRRLDDYDNICDAHDQGGVLLIDK